MSKMHDLGQDYPPVGHACLVSARVHRCMRERFNAETEHFRAFLGHVVVVAEALSVMPRQSCLVSGGRFLQLCSVDHFASVAMP